VVTAPGTSTRLSSPERAGLIHVPSVPDPHMVESDALTQRLGHVVADEVAAKVVEEKLRTVPQTPEGLYMQRELLPCVVEKQNTISQISLELERTRAALLNMRQKLDRIRCDRIHAGPTQQETSLKLLIEQVARDLAKQEEVLKEKNDQYEEFLNLCLGRHGSPSHDKSSPMELAEENLPLVQTQSLPVTQFSQDAFQKSYKWQQTSVSATSSPSHPAASPHLHKNPSSPELRRHHRETHAIASPPCGGASSFFLRRPAGSTSVPVIPRLYLGGEDDQNLARKSCVNEPWQLDVDSSSTDETSESSRYTGRSFLWRDQNGSASLPSLPKVSDLTANVRRPRRMEVREAGALDWHCGLRTHRDLHSAALRSAGLVVECDLGVACDILRVFAFVFLFYTELSCVFNIEKGTLR